MTAAAIAAQITRGQCLIWPNPSIRIGGTYEHASNSGMKTDGSLAGHDGAAVVVLVSQ